ncbi:MAG TPA: hypothetical protein DDX98_02690 [Bacteroidales bacterium]|nr:hypothetical protein [Bacteroidales bacterium]
MKQKKINTLQRLIFRKFSRKKYAAFNSLGKTIKISTLGAACTLVASPVQSQSKSDNDTLITTIELDEVEVIGQKSTVLLDDLPRIVEIIDASSIQSSPGQSFQDKIQYQSNIDISQRGQFGIQSDVSIRGGSFDQVLILQNGINLTDPQTGHHNLNIPIDPEVIYKIEILNGPAARAIGANAYSGAINIITKPRFKNQLSLSANTGAFGYMRSHIGTNLASKNTKHLLSGSYSRSDGYINNSDFEVFNFHYHGDFKLAGSTSAYTQFGYNKKGFGANSFYTPKYPDQFEETSTFNLSTGVRTGDVIKVKADAYWRRHKDRFELSREHKDYYRFEKGLVISNKPANTAYDTLFFRYINHHLTDIFGVNLNAGFRGAYGTTTVGAAARTENILSNNLGKELNNPIPVSGFDSVYYTKQDSRNSFDLYAEHVYTKNSIFLSAGALLHWNSFEPQKINFIPGIDFGYRVTQSVSLVSSYNYTIGQPTFTDLQYEGPNNIGNEDLKPYFQHSIEGGVKLQKDYLRAGFQGFYTHGRNNIDWVLDARNVSSPSYKALNIDLAENYGVEASFRFVNPCKGVTKALLGELYLGYTFVDSYRNAPDSISKYSNVKHKAVARLNQNLMKNLMLTWHFMYKQRTGTFMSYDFTSMEFSFNNYPEAFIIDLRATYLIRSTSVYIEATNLLNQHYIESGSIPQPGRWIKGGVQVIFDFD